MEYVYSKEDALKIVSGDKFYNVLFDEIVNILPKKKLIELGNKLGIKANNLYNLEPKHLLTLYNTLDISKSEGAEYKLAFENTISAIQKKIQLLNRGMIKIPCEQIEDMESLVKKVDKNNRDENKECKLAYKKIEEEKQKYDTLFNLSNVTINSIGNIDTNLTNMKQWNNDLTQLTQDDKKFEFTEKIINNTRVLGGYTLFGRKEISQKENNNKLKENSEIDIWLQSVRLLTIQQLCTSHQEITKEQFITRFANNIETEYLKLVHNDAIIRGKNKFNDLKKVLRDIRKNKKNSINQSTFIAYVASTSNQNESFIERLTKRIDNISNNISDSVTHLAVATLGQNIINKCQQYRQKLDEKANKKYGVAYTWVKDLAKNSIKSVGWGAAFGLSSTAFGPIGVSVVSAVSLARYGYPFIKDYLLEKKNYKEKGKLLTFRNYLAKNKTTSLALAFNSLSVAIPVAGALGGQLGATLNQNIALNFARANSAIAVSLCQSVNEYRKSRKNGEGHLKASCKSAMNFISGIVGFCIGNMSAQAIVGNNDIGGRDPATKVISFVKKDTSIIANEQTEIMNARIMMKDKIY